MNKKSQITIFIIIGILIVLISVFVGIRVLRNNSDIEKAGEQIVSVGFSQDSINIFISACVKQTALNAEHEYGLDKQISPPLIEQYLIDNLPKCFDDFDIFKEQGLLVEEKGNMEVSVEITNDAMLVDFIYPLTFNKGGTEINFDQESYLLPRTVMETINLDRETRITSVDGSMILEISAGTDVTLNNKPVYQVGIKLLDREFNGLSNSVLAGMLAFTGIPHGAKFSKPVKITYYYEEEDIPLTIREEDIRFGYYDDYLGVWIGLPTEVDTIKNKLTVEINHFTPQGTVINCDGSGATKIWTIESEEEQITQKCNPCTGWEIGSDTLELKTYQDITIEGETLKQLGSKEGVVTCEEKEKDIVKMHIASECPEGYERSGFEECSKTVTYYAYDSVQSLKGRKIYEIKFEELGDSCILVDESESEPNIEKILNAIEFKALCGYDHCEIEESEITFENNVLTFNLYAENRLTEGPAVSACIFAYPQVTYTGTGTREVNTIPVCEEEGERSFNDKGECQICACDHKKGGPQNIEEEICTWTSFTDCNTEETCPINYENNVDPRPDGCYVCKDGKWVEEEESLCEEVCSDDAQEEEIIDSIGSEPVPYVIKDITGMTGNSNNNNYRCNDLPDKETETDDTLITSGGGTGGGSTDDGTSGGTSRTNTRNEERKKVCPEGDDKQTEYPKCPEGFEQNYKEKVIMVKEGNIDTRDLKFCDSFRDFPDHIDNLDRNTELKIYDSALRKSQCWLLVEAQKELDGVKPDFYVKLNQVIDFIQSPETNKQTPSLTNLTNESQTNESVYLTWDIVPEAEFYIIYREGNIIEDVTEANYNDTNLKAEKEYVYYVTAYNSTFEIAESGFSNNVTTKTYENVNVSVKDKIQLIEFYNTSQNNESIYFNWTVKGNYSYSELFRESNLVYNDTLTEYNDTNLQSNTSYFYEFFARWNSTLFEYINKTFNTTS